MGSFNTTCFLSQQTIAPEDKVVLFAVQRSRGYKPVELSYSYRDYQEPKNAAPKTKTLSAYSASASTAYSDAFWSAKGPMLTGEYSDYGQFTLDNTEENNLSLKCLLDEMRTILAETHQGENQYHDHALNIKELYDPQKEYEFSELAEIFDRLVEQASEGRLFEASDPAEEISFAVMSKHAADYCLGLQTDWKDRFKKDLLNAIELSLINDDKVVEKKDIVTDMFSFTMRIEGALNQMSANRVSLISEYGELFKEFTKYLSQDIKGDNKMSDQQLADELYERFFRIPFERNAILMSLENFNTKISPIVYASQDYSNEIGSDYLKMVQHVNERLKEDLKARYGDEDEDYEENEENGYDGMKP